jgi:3D (Asp-Asp-Asp) domain-containing protein
MKILCRISVLLLASWILFKNEITSSSNKAIIPNNTKNQMVDSFIKDVLPKKEIKVRLTAYWAKGSDTDSDTARRRSSTGATLKPNKSVAVDPRIIPYFSRLYIPNLGFRFAHDTGTDVIRKKASHGKYPIVDIFFMTEKEAMRFVNNNPKIVKIAVY